MLELAIVIIVVGAGACTTGALLCTTASCTTGSAATGAGEEVGTGSATGFTATFSGWATVRGVMEGVTDGAGGVEEGDEAGLLDPEPVPEEEVAEQNEEAS